MAGINELCEIEKKMRHPLVIFVFILLIVAFGLSVIWLVCTKEFEPAITAISLLVAITSIFIDKWLTEKERRKELLVALIHELFTNLNVIKDPAFNGTNLTTIKVYPRLFSASLLTSISTGIFINKRDSKLFKLMADWQNVSANFNQRLLVTEIYLFSNPKTESIVAMNQKLSEGVTLKQTRESLMELAQHLMINYSTETGINNGTLLFNVD